MANKLETKQLNYGSYYQGITERIMLKCFRIVSLRLRNAVTNFK